MDWRTIMVTVALVLLPLGAFAIWAYARFRNSEVDPGILGDLDVRGVLAIIGLVGGLGYQFYIAANNPSVAVSELSIPSWMAATISAVIGFYFGARGGGGGNGHL
jgi:hypothetical protein